MKNNISTLQKGQHYYYALCNHKTPFLSAELFALRFVDMDEDGTKFFAVVDHLEVFLPQDASCNHTYCFEIKGGNQSFGTLQIAGNKDLQKPDLHNNGEIFELVNQHDYLVLRGRYLEAITKGTQLKLEIPAPAQVV